MEHASAVRPGELRAGEGSATHEQQIMNHRWHHSADRQGQLQDGAAPSPTAQPAGYPSSYHFRGPVILPETSKDQNPGRLWGEIHFSHKVLCPCPHPEMVEEVFTIRKKLSN